MIRSFRHKGLKALYEGKRSAKVDRSHVAKLERILSALDEAAALQEMDIPGFWLHRLKGTEKSGSSRADSQRRLPAGARLVGD
jgi:proteic killer suppression protein